MFSIKDNFKMPIKYTNGYKELSESTMNELELVNSIDGKEIPIYDEIFQPTNNASKIVLEQMANSFTTSTDFLKETQTLVETFYEDNLNAIKNKHGIYPCDVNNLMKLYSDVKQESLYDKYSYVEWLKFRNLNNNPYFLQLMSLYNITSPIITLSLPIIVLIIPFIIIKLSGIELSLSKYFEILKTLIAKNSLYKMFTEFNSVGNGQKAYLLASSSLYVFSIYQNIMACIKFYSNIQRITNYLFKMKQYIKYARDVIEYYITKCVSLSTYSNFVAVCKVKMSECDEILSQLDRVKSNTFSIYDINELGNLMCLFYQFNTNEEYVNLLGYVLGFDGYVDIISQLSVNVSKGKMSKATFSSKSLKPVIRKMVYPKLIHCSCKVENNCDLNKNMIITGPNASGKTTTLKSVLINLILSQQVGFGCYKNMKFKVYDSFHSYLNIPDTSGRDSLFQAEARRCNEIIKYIDGSDKGSSHFCIFDELYSGTNPEEAILSAKAFMMYLSDKPNVTTMLTTHYVKLCKHLKSVENIKNYHMKVDQKENGEMVYCYKLVKGISSVKGGVKVLRDMNYPSEILEKL